MKVFCAVTLTFALFAAPLTATAQPPGPAAGPAPGRGAGRQATPARGGPPREAPRGTSVLRGTVVAADNGSPIRRAQVRVVGQGVGGRLATTDAQGRFEIR